MPEIRCADVMSFGSQQDRYIIDLGMRQANPLILANLVSDHALRAEECDGSENEGGDFRREEQDRPR